MYEQERIAVIGLGFIGGYLNEGFHNLFGSSMKGHVYGIRKHRENLQKRAAELPDYILSADNTAEVLSRVSPTILVMAAPPEQAVTIAKDILLPYCSLLRRQSAPLPELYSFTPFPGQFWYADLLGYDVPVVKILPNIYTHVHGINISALGINTVSFSVPFPQSRYEILTQILSPYGTTVPLTDEESLIFLAGKITSHVCCEICCCIQEAAANAGLPVSLNEIGQALRYAQTQLFPDLPDPAPSYARCNALPGPLQQFVERLGREWFYGLHDFTLSMPVSQSPEESLMLDARSFALNIFGIALESRSELEQDTKNAATKGGVLERGIEYFHESVETALAAQAFAAAKGHAASDSFWTWLRAQSVSLSREAWTRSTSLIRSFRSPIPFHRTDTICDPR